jgi:hypothetical protein
VFAKVFAVDALAGNEAVEFVATALFVPVVKGTVEALVDVLDVVGFTNVVDAVDGLFPKK